MRELAEALQEKPAAVPGEEISPELPWRLRRWTTADWTLAGTAVAGLIVFLVLFNRVLPYRLLALPFSRATAVEKAHRLQQEFAPGTAPAPFTASYGWFWMMDRLGADASSAELLNGPSWLVDASTRDDFAWIAFDRSGELLEFWLTGAARTRTADGPVDFDRLAPSAKANAEKLFGVALQEPPRRYQFDKGRQQWVYADSRPSLELQALLGMQPAAAPYTWEVHAPGEPQQTITVWQGADRVLLASRHSKFTSRDSESWWSDAIAAGALLLALLVLAATALFFAKGLYRRTLPALLALATLSAACVTLLILQVDHGITGWRYSWELGGLPLPVVLVVGLVLLLLTYMFLAVAHYYSEKTMPHAWTTARLQAFKGSDAAGAGAAIARGLCLGTAFAGAHALLLWLILQLHGEISTLWMLPVLATSFREGAADPSIAWGLELTVPPAVMFAGLLAFVVALGRRTSASRRGPLVAAAIVWTVTVSALPGTSVYPSWALYGVCALQGAAFAWLLLRYDVLTVITMFLTIETFYLVYPLWRMNLPEDSWNYHAGFAPLALLLAGAVFLMQRTRLGGAWQRVRAVVE